jgi:predicted transposase
MRLTAQIKLLASPEQHTLLLQTLERANTACNSISQTAWRDQVFGQYRLHKKLYQQIRADFELSAQMTGARYQ